MLVERDSDGFMEWLCDFARDYGVEAMVTDDLSAYKPAVDRLGIDHQICVAHVRKRAWNRLDRIDGWDWVKARIWRLLADTPFDYDLELLRLERAVRDGDGLFAACARSWLGSGRRRYAAGGRPVDEQRGGARHREKRDKAQDGQGVQERILDAELVWAWSGRDGLDMSDLVAAQRRAAGWREPRPPKPAPK